MDYQKVSLFLLRLALAVVFLYFGFSALFNPAEQGGAWIALWATSLIFIGVVPFMLILGTLQVLVGFALILGFYLEIAGLVAAFLLLGIVINLGFGAGALEITLRDLGLLAAALVVATTKEQMLVLKGLKG